MYLSFWKGNLEHLDIDTHTFTTSMHLIFTIPHLCRYLALNIAILEDIELLLKDIFTFIKGTEEGKRKGGTQLFLSIQQFKSNKKKKSNFFFANGRKARRMHSPPLVSDKTHFFVIGREKCVMGI